MTYVPGFDVDIVITFADADNAQGTETLTREVARKWPDQKHLADRVRELEQQLATVTSRNVAIEIRGLEKGWVSGLEFILREFVEQMLGASVEIELCSESAMRDVQARVGESAVLVSVVSPAAVDERILQGQIDSFLEGSRDIESRVPARERAFAVEKLRVDSPEALARFDESHAHKFYLEDPVLRALPTSLGDAEVQEEREVLKRTFELARSIAGVLRSMRPVETLVSESRPEDLDKSEHLDEARRHVDVEVAAIGTDAKQRIEEKRPDPSQAETGSEPAAGPAHRGAAGAQFATPDPAVETVETSVTIAGTVAHVDHGGGPQAATESDEEVDSGQAKSESLGAASEPTRYTVYVDYDRRDRRAASAVAGYVKHLSEKGNVGLRLLKPHWRTEVQSDGEKELPCEHCGRSSPSRRVDEQADIDLGFLKRVRQSHVTLVVFSEAGTEWAEERQAKIIQFETDPRETPGIANVESLARAVYVHLPGQDHKRQRADMRDWTQPYDQFIQLPAKPSDSLQPKELDDFLALGRKPEGRRPEDVRRP